MSVIYATALKQTRLNAVTSAIDIAGAGSLVIKDGGSVVLVSETLPVPSFGAADGTVKITLQGVPISVAAVTGGTAASAEIWDFNNNPIVTGLTVGVGTGDVQLSTLTIGLGNTVQITAGTITHG